MGAMHRDNPRGWHCPQLTSFVAPGGRVTGFGRPGAFDMHWIVSHCTPLAPRRCAALDHVLRHWRALPREAADESTLTPPHERAHAQALGWHGDDGCLPWAARSARQDGIEVGPEAWGLVTPVHARVGSDGVHLADPETLGLDATASRALLEVLRPLFEAEDMRLVWGAPQRWYASHPSLHGLASASLDRVAGRNVEAWVPRQAAARPLRRLQNEAQMLLHEHPLNEVRETAGALPINSFWLSGCGVAQAEHASAVTLDERLRAPWLHADLPAWEAAWQALEAEALVPLIAAAERGLAVRLTLCGERGSASFEARPRPAWRRLTERVAAAPAASHDLLTTL